MIALGPDGRVLSQGSLSTALATDKKLFEVAENDNALAEKSDQLIDESEEVDGTKKSDGKLVMAEEVSEGHVGWSACELTPKSFVTRSDFDWSSSEVVVHQHAW